jgi:glycosyltransferase involved in cell wall biosynthesis
LGGGPWERLRRERQWGADISAGYDVFIDSSDAIPYFCHARKGVLLTHFPLVRFDEFHGHTTKEWRRRSPLKRILAGTFHRLEWSQRFATYQYCIVNSEFTRAWMKRLWGLKAEVVYPPLRDGLRPQRKESIVLAIGAFSNSQHKKHEVLIDAFKQLAQRTGDAWWLVMAGASGTSEEDRRYVERLRSSAQGYPIQIRTDVPGEELKDLLERSSLLWHAMGYGVDPEREPRRLEHFGMVATEAMAAGCIPIAFHGGGVPESVTHGQTGFLWSSTKELIDRTLALIADTTQRTGLSEAAVKSAERFSRHAFETRLQKALAPVLN